MKKGFKETDQRVIRLNELHRVDFTDMQLIGIGKQNKKIRGNYK